jgi:hypothetical protein
MLLAKEEAAPRSPERGRDLSSPLFGKDWHLHADITGKMGQTKHHAKEREALQRAMQPILGFLMYVTRIYPGMTPYMIGFLSTIDLWRAHRDDEVWTLIGRARRISEELAKLEGHVDAREGDEDMTPISGTGVGAPLTVTAVSWLFADVESVLNLAVLLEPPPLRKVRASNTASTHYGFDDTSGLGFGATLQIGLKLYYDWTMESCGACRFD